MSTLIIGIGSTGLNIIEHAQQYHYEFFGKNRPSNVEYVYIETDVTRSPKRTASGMTDITQVAFNLGQHGVDIGDLNGNPLIDSSWLPDTSDVLQTNSGAGGMSSYGRLSLWGSSNYNNLCSVIQSKYAEIGGDNNTQIFIVGTLTGGTGSGLCVDIPYLIKRITNNPNVNGLLLLPGQHSFSANKTIHENAFISLASIVHYTSKENTYELNWPDGSESKNIDPPYNCLQLISQDFTGARASIDKLSELIRVSGMMTMLQFAGVDVANQNYFFNTIDRRRVDSIGSNRIKNIITSGFYMIQYPKSQLSELLAIQLTKDKLSNLIDTDYYFDIQGNKKNIKTQKQFLSNQVKISLEKILSDAIDDLDGLSFGSVDNILTYINDEVAKDINNTLDSEPKRHYNKLFKSDNQDNIYELVKNNESKLKDSLINSLHDYLAKQTESFKSLEVNRVVINSIINYIDEIIKFYDKEYKINGDDSSWNKILQSELNNIELDRLSFKFMLKEKAYVSSSLKTIYDKIKLNVLIPVLRQLQKDLSKSSYPVESNSGNILPSLSKLDEIISKVNEVTNLDGSEAQYTLPRRENELYDYLDQNNKCFQMLFTKGSSSEDMKAAHNSYNANTDKKLTLSTILGTSNLWDYLSTIDDSLYNEVNSNAINFINQIELFKDNSLANILKNLNHNNSQHDELIKLMDGNESHITDRVPAMVRLNDSKFQFDNDPCAKLIFITSDHNKYNSMFKNFNFSPNSDNAVDVSSFSDCILIYKEYGYMGDQKPDFNPIEQIENSSLVKKYLKTNNQTDEKLLQTKKVKAPYLSVDQLKKYIS